MNDKTLAQRLLDILPLLKDLETGQDCAEYAFAKGDGFQAMTYCPDAFEALRVLPEAIDTIEAQATRIEALEAVLYSVAKTCREEIPLPYVGKMREVLLRNLAEWCEQALESQP